MGEMSLKDNRVIQRAERKKSIRESESIESNGVQLGGSVCLVAAEGDVWTTRVRGRADWSRFLMSD
jgi:hypothetical protein